MKSLRQGLREGRLSDLLICLLGFCLQWSSLARAELKHSFDPKVSINTLDGLWDFYPGLFLQAGDPIPPEGLLLYGGVSWKQAEQLQTFTQGTYRLVLEDLAPRKDGYELEIRDIGGAGRLIVYPLEKPEDRQEIELGFLELEPGKSQFFKSKKVLNFGRAGGGSSFVLLLQVRNDQHFQPGLRIAPRLAAQPLLSSFDRKQRVANIIAFACLWMMALWNFALFSCRREDKAPLYLGLACVAIGLRALIFSYLPEEWMPLLPLSLPPFISKLEYFTIPMAALAIFELQWTHSALRMKEALPHAWLRLIGLLLMILVMALPYLCQSWLAYLLQAYAVLMSAGILILMLRSWHKKQRFAWIPLLGVLPLFFCLFYDIALSIFQIDNLFITQFGMMLFLFSQNFLSALLNAEQHTRQKMLNHQLLDTYEALLEKDMQQALFFQKVAHELRTPLHGLLAQWHPDRSGLAGRAEDQPEFLARSRQLVQELQREVEALLVYVYPSSQAIKMRAEKSYLYDFAEHCESLLLELKPKDLNLSWQMEVDESEASQLGIFVDREKIFLILRKFLLRLLQDAKQKNLANVQFSFAQTQRFLKVQICFRTQLLPHREIQEWEQSREILFVREILRHLNGTSDLHRQDASHVNFSLRIPEWTGEQEFSRQKSKGFSHEAASPSELGLKKSAPPHAQAEERPKDRIRPSDYRILIVDDKKLNLEVLQELLLGEGFQTDICESGRLALEKMRLDPPDLLLLDMMMPEMSGEDVLRIMRADEYLKSIPVIIITARANHEDRLLGLDLGADDYVAKPVHAKELDLRIRNLLLRTEAGKKLGQRMQQEKWQQQSEHFSELSHELKNIFQGLGQEAALAAEYYNYLIHCLPLSKPSLDLLLKGLKTPVPAEAMPNLNWVVPSHDQTKQEQERRELATILSQWPLSLEDKQVLWHELMADPQKEVWQAVRSFLSFILSHQLLLNLLRHAESLSSVILDLNRGPSRERKPCQAVFQSLFPLLKKRLERLQIRLEFHGPSQLILPISTQALQQISLNLLLNAIDALSERDVEDRWIRIAIEEKDKVWILRYSNGGPAIPQFMHDKLFKRGFTSKGSRGSGIGLYLSRKLAQDEGHSLHYDSESRYPSFVLSLQPETSPLAEPERLLPPA